MKFSPTVRAEELEPARFEKMFYFLRCYGALIDKEGGGTGTFMGRDA
jgi:hypothetical protein